MLGCSAAFTAALRAGAPSIVTAVATRAGTGQALLVDSDNPPTITISATDAVRRRFKGSIIDPDGSLAPTSPGDLLAPYGTEVRLYVGFEGVDVVPGTREDVPLGIFPLFRSDADGRGRVELAGADRSSVVAARLFEYPYFIPIGSTYVDGNGNGAIHDLIESRYPGLTYLAPDGGAANLTGELIVFEEGTRSGTPWRNAQELAASIGYEVFFDAIGRVVIRRIPNPALTPHVFEYLPNAESILLASSNALDTSSAYNIAVVIGEGPENVPVRGSSEITDVGDPMYPGGPMGRRPRVVNDPSVTDQSQADSASVALLAEGSGGSEVLGFTAGPIHPCHEGGDVVIVENADLGLVSAVVMESWTLDASLRKPSNVQTRAKRAS